MALFTADTTTAASNAKPTYQPSATNPSFRVPLFSLSMILSLDKAQNDTSKHKTAEHG